MTEKHLTRFYREMIDAVSDGLMIVGPDGKILLANKAMEEITGYTRKELVQASCRILDCDVCEQARTRSREKWCLLFEHGRSNRKRCLIARKNGAYAPMMKTASLVKDKKGRIFGALETFSDLSEMDKKDQQIRQLAGRLMEDGGFHGIIGKSPAIRGICQLIEKAAGSDAPVIISGETGTGKELVAQAIHKIGRRREGPFVQFNCAAINESLCESELFGHTKGAFTGAYRHHRGRFEAAHGGDIFLDEIGEISITIQAKLLRVLETRIFERVGENRPLHADVRIIAATNKDLTDLISLGKFRQDLFYRINVLPIHLPPLRERMEDVSLLVNVFMRELRKKNQKPIRSVSPEVMDLFMRYRWPGNIRELKSALEYAFIIAGAERIELEHLPDRIQAFTGRSQMPAVSAGNPEDSKEKIHLIEALRQSHGNKSKAAQILGVHRMTVCNRMKKFGIRLNKNLESDNQ